MVRKIKDIEIGTEIVILKATSGWASVRRGDIGIIRINRSYSTKIDFPNHIGWRLDRSAIEGVHFEIANKDFIKF